MNAVHNRETPFQLQISFHKYLDFLEHVRDNDEVDYRVNYAKSLLENSQNLKELRDGTEDTSFITENEELLKILLADLFPTALTKNEIKAATIPFSDFCFNFTERFRTILDDAGKEFELDLRDISADEFYVFNCCVILQSYFKKEVAISLPFYYDIPDSRGVMKHYRITINADFTDILPTEFSKFPNEGQITELLNNFEDIHLWKKFFPPKSWILKGFSIISLTDATSEVALSDIKTTMLNIDPENIEADPNLTEYFRSYMDVPDLNFGIMLFDQKTMNLEYMELYRSLFSNAILDFWTSYSKYDPKMRETIFQNLLYNPKPFVVSDVDLIDEELQNHPSFENLQKNNIRSFIVIPIVKDGKILALLEISSSKKNALTGLKLKKLDYILPYILNTLNRFKHEKSNQIDSIIQKEYTSIHPSVMWKFEEQAEKSFNAQFVGENYTLREISFKNLVPFFGQTDIRASSLKREECLALDLKEQINALYFLFNQIDNPEKEKYILALNEFEAEISDSLKADTENRFQRLMLAEIHPFLENYGEISRLYFEILNPKNLQFYRNRGNLDEAIRQINLNLSNFLDQKQKKAQKIYPHYFEKFKSDGVEYDMFAGQSITPNIVFDEEIISKLRYWQLKTMAKMERNYNEFKATLPYALDVASMILVYDENIDIRFRMDEKRFDVDGAFNTRYEIIKKRLEKATLKNSTERLALPGKIAIVYYAEESKQQYLQFIEKLQNKGLLHNTLEDVEIENLQGITGLRALRVSI